jgi:hypothetical protein
LMLDLLCWMCFVRLIWLGDLWCEQVRRRHCNAILFENFEQLSPIITY